MSHREGFQPVSQTIENQYPDLPKLDSEDLDRMHRGIDITLRAMGGDVDPVESDEHDELDDVIEFGSWKQLLGKASLETFIDAEITVFGIVIAAQEKAAKLVSRVIDHI